MIYAARAKNRHSVFAFRWRDRPVSSEFPPATNPGPCPPMTRSRREREATFILLCRRFNRCLKPEPHLCAAFKISIVII